MLLTKRSKDGSTPLSHLRKVERATGETPAALLNEPELPICLDGIYTIYHRIQRTCSFGFSAQNPITYSEIRAWQELYGVRLPSWMIEAVVRVDGVRLRLQAGEEENKRASSKKSS